MGTAYKKLRAGIEQAGGRMTYERLGTRYGAWIVSYEGKSKTFESNGAGFPDLDRYYLPKVAVPSSSSDYTNQLIPEAVSKLLNSLEMD